MVAFVLGLWFVAIVTVLLMQQWTVRRGHEWDNASRKHRELRR